jgi:hypothetical protein
MHTFAILNVLVLVPKAATTGEILNLSRHNLKVVLQEAEAVLVMHGFSWASVGESICKSIGFVNAISTKWEIRSTASRHRLLVAPTW